MSALLFGRVPCASLYNVSALLQSIRHAYDCSFLSRCLGTADRGLDSKQFYLHDPDGYILLLVATSRKLVRVNLGWFLRRTSSQKFVVADCGGNKRKATDNRWDQMSQLQKPLILLVVQLDSNQFVNFSYFPSFGTVRSEVRILSPRPIKSSTYGQRMLPVPV